MPSEISVPFRLDGNGQVVATDDLDDQVHLHVLALLNTQPPERVMVPGYGTDLLGLMFEDDGSDEIATQATLRIKAAMKTWEPGVDLVTAAPEPGTEQDNTSVVSVQYRRLDAPDSATSANANMAIIGANGVVKEVVRG